MPTAKQYSIRIAYCNSSEQKNRQDNESGVGFRRRNREREKAQQHIVEQDANARLIAAAPELLELVREIAETSGLTAFVLLGPQSRYHHLLSLINDLTSRV